MDNNSIAICISIGTFAASVLSPIFVSLISNCFELKKHKANYYEAHRSAVIEDYLKSVGKYIFGTSYEQETEFGGSVAEIFMYTPQEYWESIDAMNKAIAQIRETKDSENRKPLLHNAKYQYFELCKDLSPLSRNPTPEKYKAGKK